MINRWKSTTNDIIVKLHDALLNVNYYKQQGGGYFLCMI